MSAFVLQFYNMILSLTVFENVALVNDIAGKPLDPLEVLKLFGLERRIEAPLSVVDADVLHLDDPAVHFRNVTWSFDGSCRAEFDLPQGLWAVLLASYLPHNVRAR
jgi:hypothetical protein